MLAQNSYKILIINQNWMGDVLFSTPAIHAIRIKYPFSFIACVVPPRCAAVLENNPDIDELIIHEDRMNFLSALFFSMKLKSYQFNAAYLFHSSLTKARAVKMAGIPKRIGYIKKRKVHALYTTSIPQPSAPMHKIDYFLMLLKATGIHCDSRQPLFITKPGSFKSLNDKLSAVSLPSGKPYIVVHAGGNWDLKRWPKENFVRLIELFLKKYPGYFVILCGSNSEKFLCNEIQNGVNSPFLINFCSKTDLNELAILLKGSALMISNDSGPIHLAASQSANILGIFGPTDPNLTGPVSLGKTVILKKDVGCEVPCYFSICDLRVCMQWIFPEEVLLACGEFIQ